MVEPASGPPVGQHRQLEWECGARWPADGFGETDLAFTRVVGFISRRSALSPGVCAKLSGPASRLPLFKGPLG